jgi:hypothetical protein
MVLLESQV